MSFDPQICIDTAFDAFGVAATLDPDGQARRVLMLPAEAEAVGDFNGQGYIRERGVYELRAADVQATDVQGGVDGMIFEIGGERRRIETHVYRDPRRLKAILNTVPVIGKADA